MSETTVQQAWAAVMSDVRALAKGDRNTFHNFSFRGIDAVMNAVGPVLRDHEVAVIPNVRDAAHRDVQTSKGKPSREATVLVEYTIVGPSGDTIVGSAAGEAMDEGDKGTAKAMSVALRTFLLQSLCLPTEETDPDAQSYERAPEQTPAEKAAEGAKRIEAATTVEQVRALGNAAHSQGLLDETPFGSASTLRELVQQRIAALSSDDRAAEGDAA